MKSTTVDKYLTVIIKGPDSSNSLQRLQVESGVLTQQCYEILAKLHLLVLVRDSKKNLHSTLKQK